MKRLKSVGFIAALITLTYVIYTWWSQPMFDVWD